MTDVPQSASPKAIGMEYTYDIFISYRRVRKLKTWIRKYFFEQFTDALEVELGREPDIFWDEEGIETGDAWRARVLNSLQTAVCIVPILSKPYFKSKWCMAEWTTFMNRARDVNLTTPGLAFPIQWHDGDSYPRGATEIRPIDFRDYALTGDAFRSTKGYLSYERELSTFAEKVADRIENPPPFDQGWQVIRPDEVQVNQDEEIWDHTLRDEDG